MYQKLKTGVWCQSIDKEMRVIVKVIFKVLLPNLAHKKKFILKTTLKSEASSANLCIVQVTVEFFLLRRPYSWQKLFTLFSSSSKTWIIS